MILDSDQGDAKKRKHTPGDFLENLIPKTLSHRCAYSLPLIIRSSIIKNQDTTPGHSTTPVFVLPFCGMEKLAKGMYV
jgi:hypothetical protein